jgi:hypothetical protein
VQPPFSSFLLHYTDSAAKAQEKTPGDMDFIAKTP